MQTQKNQKTATARESQGLPPHHFSRSFFVAQLEYLKKTTQHLLSFKRGKYNQKTATAREMVWGFTLIETLVAISVLLMGILGPMALAQKSLSTAVHTNDQVTAFFLAQDAVEYIKNVRDSDRVAGTNNFTFLNSCVGVQGCTVNTVSAPAGAFSACASGGCSPLHHNSTTGKYAQTSGAGWVSSNFTRQVRFYNLASYEKLVEVRVTWFSNGQARTLVLDRYFYDLDPVI